MGKFFSQYSKLLHMSPQERAALESCDGIDSRVCRGYGWFDDAARRQHMRRALANTVMGPASMAGVGQPAYTALLYDLITDTEC